MKILVDMNLSPTWVEFLSSNGFEAVHSSAIGQAKTSDYRLMEFARESGYLVFTHDLDFGNILAATNARGPSVIQVRTQNPLPEAIGEIVLLALRTQSEQLSRGALITVEPTKFRVRVLPLRSL